MEQQLLDLCSSSQSIKNIVEYFLFYLATLFSNFRFPNENMFDIGYEFMWGKALLIAPLLEEVVLYYIYLINTFYQTNCFN